MQVANAVLARRLDHAARAYLVARYSGPGNPMGASILERDGVIATKVPFVPHNALMNCATGIERADQLDDVLDFYGATGQPCWVEVSPYTPVEVTDALLRSGFTVERYGSSLYAAPLPGIVGAADAAHGATISQVGPGGLDVFLDTLNTGFGTPPGLLDGLRANQGFWSSVPDWHLFQAHVGTTCAGAAVLSMHGEIAYLAAASTLPEYRNRGIQAALIAARITTGRALGAGIVSGQAEWGGSSQANMQRAGLQISHVRTIWTNRRSDGQPAR